MVIIDTTHALTEKELSLLNSLIGEGIWAIVSSGVEMLTSSKIYQFSDTIDLKLDKGPDYLSITADFDETKFGEDLHRIDIQQTKIPRGAKTDNGVFREPHARLSISPKFIIETIDVYGYSYQSESDNINPNTSWLVEKENPGQPIQENVETENILLFHSTDGRQILIEPIGAFPWISVNVDDQTIDPIQKNLRGESLTKLKRTIR